MAQQPIIVSPQGGMNQDDSLVTPAKDAAGKSLFEVGDYRYALNARIGSSRNDHFGDLETIRATMEVTSYFRRSQRFTNENFDGFMTPWKTIERNGTSDPGAHWEYTAPSQDSGPKPCVSIRPGYNDILYQDNLILFGATKATIAYKYRMPAAAVTDMKFVLYFMNGTTIISDFLLDTRVTRNTVNNDYIDAKVNVDLPSNCDSVGVYVSGTSNNLLRFYLASLKISVDMPTTKPDGDERVVGRYEDHEFLRLYYCVYNSNMNHSIRYFDVVSGNIYQLVQWSGLNYTETSHVKMSKLDNWLSMTDRSNPPRLINVDTIADFADQLLDSIREFHLSYHKWSPVSAPIVKKYYDGVTNNSELLRDKMWQFSFRYVYKNNLFSRWSPFSVAASVVYRDVETNPLSPITAIAVRLNGLFFNEEGSDDAFNYFDNDNFKCQFAIDSIQIAFRDSGDGIWRLWKTVPVSENIQYFDGKFDNTLVNADDINQPFDTVPFLSGTVEAIDNRFVFFDNLDEQEPAQEPIVQDVFVSQNSNNSPDWSSTTGVVFTGLSTTNQNELANRNSLTQRTFKSRGIYKLGIQYLHRNGWRSAVYTSPDWIYNIPTKTIFDSGNSEPKFALNFAFSLGFKPPSWAVAYQIMRTNCLNIDSFMFGTCNSIQPIIDDVSAYVSGLSSVSQDLRNAISQYFLNTPLTEQDFKGDINKIVGGLGSGHRDSIYWATVQYIRKTAEVGITGDASRLFINVKNWYNASKKDSSGSKDNPMNNLYYNWRRGDRCRFVASNDANPGSAQKAIFDAKILDFTGDGIIVERPASVKWVPTKSGTAISDDYLVEVYTPKEQSADDIIFYESGEWYPVLYPSTDQRTWSKRDWTYTNLGTITATQYSNITVFNKLPFFFGDCSRITKFIYNDFRPNSSGILYLRDIPSMSNIRDQTYGVWEKSDGRPALAYSTYPVKRFKTTQARFSGKIVEESFINNLNRMKDEDQFIYPSEYGRIMDVVNTSNAQVESTGSILLAIGQRETWSIYVNRTTLEDLSGRSQVSLSDKVLGAFNVLLGSRGTLNPESVTKYRGRVYWWDVLNGTWCRYGRDGLTDISSYKMRNWFREISELIEGTYQTASPARAISGFDAFNEELITFIDHDSMPDQFRGYDSYKGSLFSEEDVRWKGCHDLQPDMMGRINNKLITFKNGGVYLYEGDDSLYSTFFGVKYDVKYEPVITTMLNTVNYQSVGVMSTDRWSVERILSEYRGTKAKQESRIPLESFENKEDTFWAAIKRDVTSTGGIINGRPMKSRAVQVLLKLDPAIVTLSLLHYVAMELQDSPKNA